MTPNSAHVILKKCTANQLISTHAEKLSQLSARQRLLEATRHLRYMARIRMKALPYFHLNREEERELLYGVVPLFEDEIRLDPSTKKGGADVSFGR
jgi:hypothetical protein